MMPVTPDLPVTRSRWLSPSLLLGFGAVAAARVLTVPRSLWEGDEVLFVKGIERFDPLHHQPHPPGYPLLIGLGKLLNLLLHDPFVSLVTLSVISSLIGYLALVDAFRRIGGSERVAVAGAILFHLSPAMLIYGPLPLSDPPALMFLSLALAAAARLRESASPGPALALGAAASAAVGCRPQLALAVLPMLAVALWPARPRWMVVGLGAFGAVSLLWFVPLVVAVGGPAGLLPFLGKQAGLVAQYDAGAPRAGGGALQVATRFLAHPWGTRWTSFPVLALAAAGAVALAATRRIGALPLAVLCAVDLVFALLVMNPFDAVRYALPSLLGVAFAAAVGCDALVRRIHRPWMPFAVWPAAALLAAGFIVYTEPFLAMRATMDSPPVQAARWIDRSLPKTAVLVVEAELAPHASYLLRKYLRIPADPGLQREPENRLVRPDFLLGDGESLWPGTMRFLWPESDAYGKLSRGHLRVVSLSPIPPDRWYVPLRGVYAFEPSLRQPLWRWLGPDAAIRLSPPGSRVAVTLGLPGHAPVAAVAVTVAVDGGAAETVTVPRGERRTVDLPVRAGEPVEVSFRSPVSFVPAEAGLGPDRRRLAVQLLGAERKAP
ncbi:MAG TPA: glycosyltransferase family 39 protein [Thermoanaerobaculia bacterium]|nr:glycosyltransferase family 39 protein [Thermoanaerobaculia bacterium]